MDKVRFLELQEGAIGALAEARAATEAMNLQGANLMMLSSIALSLLALVEAASPYPDQTK